MTHLKKYLLFAHLKHRNSGGWRDFVDSYSNLRQARQGFLDWVYEEFRCKGIGSETFIVQVIDRISGEVVLLKEAEMSSCGSLTFIPTCLNPFPRPSTETLKSPMIPITDDLADMPSEAIVDYLKAVKEEAI